MQDWSVGPVVKQNDFATDVPDMRAYAETAIAESGRAGIADLKKVLVGISNVLVGQMDIYASQLSGIDTRQVEEMRQRLYTRPDFRLEMLVVGLTYFGPSGTAMNNGLVEQLDQFYPELVTMIGAGNFDA